MHETNKKTDDQRSERYAGAKRKCWARCKYVTEYEISRRSTLEWRNSSVALNVVR